MSTVQEELAALKRTVENIKDPLYRFFERECTIGRNLLRTVLTDLNDVAQVGLLTGVWDGDENLCHQYYIFHCWVWYGAEKLGKNEVLEAFA